VSFKIIPTTRFEKEAKKISRVYPDFKYNVEKLTTSLAAQPAQGSHLGHGIYKVRIPITGKPFSKSYGARVIHAVFSVHESVYLITVYDKSVKKDLDPSELKEIIQQVKELRKS
jgi:hypothetical protein